MRPEVPPNPAPIPGPEPISPPPIQPPTEPEVPFPPTGPEVVPSSIPEKPDLPPPTRGNDEAGKDQAGVDKDKDNAYKWSTGGDEQRELVLEHEPTQPGDAKPQ